MKLAQLIIDGTEYYFSNIHDGTMHTVGNATPLLCFHNIWLVGIASVNKPDQSVNKNFLFTTEDGVDIFENSLADIWLLSINNWIVVKLLHLKNTSAPFTGNGQFKYFSSWEAAEDYVVKNKPIEISYNELISLFTEKDIYPFGNFSNKVKDFFHSKIKPQKT